MSKLTGNLEKGDLFRLVAEGMDVTDLFVKKPENTGYEWGRMSKDPSSPVYNKYVNHTVAEEYFYQSIDYFHPKNYPFLNPNPEVDLRREFVGKEPKEFPLKEIHHEGFTPNEVARTIVEYVITSSDPPFKQKRDLMNWIFFAALSDVLFTYLSAVSNGLIKAHGVGHSHPAESDNDGFITLITGGMSLRTYFPSHYSADIDVKLFPKNMNSSMNPEQVLNDIGEWALTKTFMEYLNHHGYKLVMIYLQQLMEYPVLSQLPLLREIYSEFFSFYNMMNQFQEQYGYVENATMMNEQGIPVVAFHVLFEQPPGPKTLYKCTIQYKGMYYQLMDMSVYDKEDTTYNALITSVRRKMSPFHPEKLVDEYGTLYKINDPEQQMIPFRLVPVLYHSSHEKGEGAQAPRMIHRLKKAYFHIPIKQFLKVEKEVLLHDLQGDFMFNEEAQYNPSLREYLMNKFHRTLQTFVDGNTRPRTYVGGKRRKKTRGRKKTYGKNRGKSRGKSRGKKRRKRTRKYK